MCWGVQGRGLGEYPGLLGRFPAPGVLDEARAGFDPVGVLSTQVEGRVSMLGLRYRSRPTNARGSVLVSVVPRAVEADPVLLVGVIVDQVAAAEAGESRGRGVGDAVGRAATLHLLSTEAEAVTVLIDGSACAVRVWEAGGRHVVVLERPGYVITSIGPGGFSRAGLQLAYR